MAHIIITTGDREKPIDADHWFITVGPNCWGRGETVKEAYKAAYSNRWHGKRGQNFITRVCPRDGFGIDPVDGSVSWSERHNAKACPLCTVGKGLRIGVE